MAGEEPYRSPSSGDPFVRIALNSKGNCLTIPEVAIWRTEPVAQSFRKEAVGKMAQPIAGESSVDTDALLQLARDKSSEDRKALGATIADLFVGNVSALS
jgi:hypothetical protein